ncbi:MAG: hypothetical protein RLZZ360_889 [Candidatus Parcubacteria bacterium]|jgi:hypothetical protein
MVAKHGTIPTRKDLTVMQQKKGTELFRSVEEMEGWLMELATSLADQLSVGGIKIDERTVYEALCRELTVGDVMKLAG